MEDQRATRKTDEKDQSNKVAESGQSEKNVASYSQQDPISLESIIQSRIDDPKSGSDAAQREALRDCDPAGEVNMEATINPDDVIRAGGFGARDDLSSVLPIASDATDLESSLLDARNYEEPQDERRRPGLGWGEDRESK